VITWLSTEDEYIFSDPMGMMGFFGI
jgi:hypothetical protein